VTDFHSIDGDSAITWPAGHGYGRERLEFVSLAKPVVLAGILISATMMELYGTVPSAVFTVLVPILLYLCIADRTFRPTVLNFLVPIFAVASTLWSDEPAITLRTSLILLVTALGTILCCGSLPPRRFALWMALALYVTLPLHFLFGSNFFNAGFAGLLHSKNFFGARMMITLFFALTVILDRKSPNWARIISVPATLLSVYGIIIANSAGAFVATAASLGAFAFATMLRMRNTRALSMILLLSLLAGLATTFMLAMAWNDINAFVLALFSKDAGLSGRDYLWHLAALYIQEHPLLGTGFGAFWVQGHIEAEGLWRAMNIQARNGFHFHNIFLNITVELGLVGLAMLVIFMVSVTGSLVRYVWKRNDTAAPFVALWVMVLMRAYVEVDYPWGFQLVSMMIMAVAWYVSAPAGARPVS
jgi:exopolysaccharide production protein ExoQ